MTSPVRRIYIPKPGTDEKRPLGIPNIEDRAKQALLKLALEPEWEAYFEPNSYGFRPGKNCHDAITQIKLSIERCPKYVLDADISKCFDKINHDYLLEKLALKGKLRKQVKAWLKAGYVAFPSKNLEPTKMGTPQGGVISPLLANIALHGLEITLKELSANTKPQFFQNGKKIDSKQLKRNALTVVRYADDFVVMHTDKELLHLCKEEIERFLKPIGLELSSTKTRISHTLDGSLSEDGKKGFNFLGFKIFQYRTTKRSAVNSSTGQKLGFHTLFIPSQKAWMKHKQKIKEVLKCYTDQNALISHLNPIIIGWSNYFGVSSVYITKTFQKYDEYVYQRLRKWAYQRTKNHKIGFLKYWYHNGKRWVFGNSKHSLHKHLEFATYINNYVKVKGKESPFNDNVKYWSKRLSQSPELFTSEKKLLSRQKGICSFCNLPFFPDDIMEKHHVISKKLGGTDTYINLQLLHGHCHDKVHSNKLSNIVE